MERRTYGFSSPAARASTAVCTSAVMTSWSCSMPRTIAFATGAASRGLIAAEIFDRLGRLELVLAVEAGRARVGRVHARDDDAVRCELGAQRLREPAHRELGRRVRRVPEDPDQAGGRRHEHEVPSATRHHRRDHRPHRVQRPEVVDLHLLTEHRVVEPLEVAGVGRPRARHEHVARPRVSVTAVDARHRARRGRSRRRPPSPPRPRGHVGDLRDRRRELRVVARDQRDLCPLRGKAASRPRARSRSSRRSRSHDTP